MKCVVASSRAGRLAWWRTPRLRMYRQSKILNTSLKLRVHLECRDWDFRFVYCIAGTPSALGEVCINRAWMCINNLWIFPLLSFMLFRRPETIWKYLAIQVRTHTSCLWSNIVGKKRRRWGKRNIGLQQISKEKRMHETIVEYKGGRKGLGEEHGN